MPLLSAELANCHADTIKTGNIPKRLDFNIRNVSIHHTKMLQDKAERILAKQDLNKSNKKIFKANKKK